MTMRPGGGAPACYAHSSNRHRKAVRNAHISYNFEDDEEDENSLFIPDRRNGKSSHTNSATERRADDDVEAMFADINEDEEGESGQGQSEETTPVFQPPRTPNSGSSTGANSNEVMQRPLPRSISDGVATRLAAIRASRTPIRRQRSTTPAHRTPAPSMAPTSTSYINIPTENPAEPTEQPAMTLLEQRRAELARIRATRTAVNKKNEEMLQAIEAAKVSN